MVTTPPGLQQAASVDASNEARGRLGYPMRAEPAGPGVPVWVLGAAAGVGLLVLAAFIVLAMQVSSSHRRAEALEARVAELGGQVEALRAAEAASAAQARQQVDELRRRVEALGAARVVAPPVAAPVAPPPARQVAPPPPAPPPARPAR